MAKPDGYKILCSMFPDGAIQVATQRKIWGSRMKISSVYGHYTSTPGALAVKKDSSLKNMNDLSTSPKENPGKLTRFRFFPNLCCLHVLTLRCVQDRPKPRDVQRRGEAINALLGTSYGQMSGGHFVIPGPKGAWSLSDYGGTKRFEKCRPNTLSNERTGGTIFPMKCAEWYCAPKGPPNP